MHRVDIGESFQLIPGCKIRVRYSRERPLRSLPAFCVQMPQVYFFWIESHVMEHGTKKTIMILRSFEGHRPTGSNHSTLSGGLGNCFAKFESKGVRSK